MHILSYLPRDEDGFVGGLIIGVIIGAIVVIWLLFKLIGAIFEHHACRAEPQPRAGRLQLCF